MRIMAIDPGDRWCGYAVLKFLHSEPSRFVAECGVLDREPRDFAGIVNDLIPDDDRINQYVFENFQVRSQGFNHFTGGETLKLIGGLSYKVSAMHRPFAIVQQGDPADLNRLILGQYVSMWKEYWNRASQPTWLHAISAWAILSRYLMHTDTALLSRLIVKPLPKIELSGTPIHPKFRTDLIAPIVSWEIP